MTLQNLRQIVCATLQVDPSSVKDEEIDQASLKAWDSLRHLRLIVALEKETRKKFTARQIAGMVSLSAIAKEVGIR